MKYIFNFIRSFILDIRFILSRQVPLGSLPYFLKINLVKKILHRNIRTIYSAEFSKWLRVKKDLSLSNDWFSSHVPFWLSAIKDYDLRDKHLKVLEIGSWEGLSSFFILSEIPNAYLTCVDTWEGSVEHKSYNFASEFNLLNIEKTFDEIKLNEGGKVPEDWWVDIQRATRYPNEPVGYPTQKSIKLLERIIKASS